MPRNIETPLSDLTPESRAEALQNAYESALNDMSVESFGNYYEDLMGRGIISALEFEAYDRLPVSEQIRLYCLAIVACPRSSEHARTYAKRHLENLPDGKYNN